LTLTDAGARLFPAIRGGLEAFAAAIAAVKQDGDQQPLRVTTTNAFASRWLVPRLPALHPDAPLEVIGTDSVLDLQADDGDVAIRYATSRATSSEGITEELLSDTFWPVCNPRLLSLGRLKRPADLAKHVLIHSYWSPADREPPTWQRWLARAERRWRHVPEFKDMQHLSFREELHAIEAVIAGQGVGIFSDVLVAPELASGSRISALGGQVSRPQSVPISDKFQRTLKLGTRATLETCSWNILVELEVDAGNFLRLASLSICIGLTREAICFGAGLTPMDRSGA
jgi:LysR family transcriptional regulator, glycine cleavage system transcriptional activator